MRALSLLLMLPGLALAQTGLIVQPATPPRGVTLPPTSAALVDEATALSVNPAGLRFVGPRSSSTCTSATSWRPGGRWPLPGLDAAGRPGRRLQPGVAARTGLPDYRKTSFGLALGSRKLSLGAAYHGFSSDDAALDRLSGFDLGLTAAARALPLGGRGGEGRERAPGGALHPAAPIQPGRGRAPLRRARDAGRGLPRRRRAPGTKGASPTPLQAAVVPGLGLGAGLSHGLGGDRTLALQFAATLDSSRFGLTYAGGGAEGGGLDHVVAVRLSAQKYPGLRLGGGSVALVDLDDELREGGGPTLALLGFTEPDPYLRLTRWLDEATKDPRLQGVVLKMSGLPGVDWGKADELHQAVLRLRAAGKRVLAMLYSVDDRAYFVASAADEVYALPSRLAAHQRPVRQRAATLGGTMEKLGVTWDVARVGEYKTAPEQLTRRDMSPAAARDDRGLPGQPDGP